MELAVHRPPDSGVLEDDLGSIRGPNARSFFVASSSTVAIEVSSVSDTSGASGTRREMRAAGG